MRSRDSDQVNSSAAHAAGDETIHRSAVDMANVQIPTDDVVPNSEGPQHHAMIVEANLE